MAGQVLKITEMHTTVGCVQPQVEVATLFEDCNALATMSLEVFIIRTSHPLTCATRTSYGIQAYMAQLMFESIYFVSRTKCIIME